MQQNTEEANVANGECNGKRKDRVVQTHFSKFDMQEVTWKCNNTICSQTSSLCVQARFRIELGYREESLWRWMENVFVKAYPDTYWVYDEKKKTNVCSLSSDIYIYLFLVCFFSSFRFAPKTLP